MNKKINSNRRFWNRKFLAIIAALTVLPLGFATSEDIEEVKEKNLVVNIDDPLGFFSVDAEWLREDLLETAFYEAAARQKLKDFELTYNGATPKNARGVLEFRIISWRRSVANMYEFTTAARYLNADGDEIKLGVFRGYRSGIDVFIGRDIGEHFADTAEDAFRQALRKLDEKLS